MEPYIIYSLIGKLTIFLVQKSPYQNIIGRIIGRIIGSDEIRRFLQELFSCDLCLGVWIYWLLAWIMKINMYNFYVPVISEFLTGASVAFVMHLVSIGWKEKFSIIHIS